MCLRAVSTFAGSAGAGVSVFGASTIGATGFAPGAGSSTLGATASGLAVAREGGCQQTSRRVGYETVLTSSCRSCQGCGGGLSRSDAVRSCLGGFGGLRWLLLGLLLFSLALEQALELGLQLRESIRCCVDATTLADVPIGVWQSMAHVPEELYLL